MPFLPSFYTVQVAFAPLPIRYLNALRQIEVEASSQQASIFRLRFELSRTLTGDWDALEIDIFRPLVPVTISVSLGSGIREVLINGYVHDASLENSNQPGKSVLQVVGMDATSTLMNLQEKLFPWPNMSDSSIATAIFGQYGIVPLTPQPTAPSRTVNDITTLQRGTDVRFLKQLARRNSFECFVQPEPLSGLDTGYFGPPRIDLPQQGVLSINFGASTNMQSFSAYYAMLQPTSALATVLDPTTKAPLPGLGVAATESPMGREPALLRVIPPPVVRPVAREAANGSELMTNAGSIANRSSRAIQGNGTVDSLQYRRALRPGLPVLVRGAGKEYSGKYYVTQVTHTLSEDEYTQRFSAWRNAIGLSGTEVFVDPLAALS